MKKINFQNGKEPAINDTNLNQMQDNMEEVGVVVSPTQPTTHEKVWIQKGKNLFNKNGLILVNKRLDSGNSSVYTQADCFTSDYIEILPNQDYSLQGINAYHIYNENKEKITQNFYDGDNNDIIITNSNAKYIRVSTWDINQLMIAQGSATEYEEYVEKRIWCKNINGVYEEFGNVEKINEVQNNLSNYAPLSTTPQTPYGNTQVTRLQLYYDNGFVLRVHAITEGVEHIYHANLTQID